MSPPMCPRSETCSLAPFFFACSFSLESHGTPTFLLNITSTSYPCFSYHGHNITYKVSALSCRLFPFEISGAGFPLSPCGPSRPQSIHSGSRNVHLHDSFGFTLILLQMTLLTWFSMAPNTSQKSVWDFLQMVVILPLKDKQG